MSECHPNASDTSQHDYIIDELKNGWMIITAKYIPCSKQRCLHKLIIVVFFLNAISLLAKHKEMNLVTSAMKTLDCR